MNAHFIDLDIILKVESKPWIVSKDNPNIPLMKVDPSDFKMFQSGVYRSQNNKLDFNGKTFWLSDSFMNKVKLSSKKYRVDISNLAISMQEYMNPELIENVPYDINLDLFESLVNTNDDIYIICSRNTKRNYTKQIEKLTERLKEMGLVIKNFYFISETFMNRNDDDIAFNKVKLLLQHLIGLKADGDKLTNEDITDYDQITYYDDSKPSIELAKRINSVLENLMFKSGQEVKLKIRDKINGSNLLRINEWTYNKAKRFNDSVIVLEYSNIIKNFENYKYD